MLSRYHSLIKAKDYERDVLPVFSEEYDVTTSLASPAQVELMGCVDVDQAYNYAKHYLRANKYEVRTCTFELYRRHSVHNRGCNPTTTRCDRLGTRRSCRVCCR